MARGKQSNTLNGHGSSEGFEEKLWRAADKLRGHMDAADYKHVLLGIIFLKYLSDASSEGDIFLEVDGSPAVQGSGQSTVRVPMEARWSELRDRVRQRNIGELLDAAMMAVEKANPALTGMLSVGYSRPSLDPQQLGELIELVGAIRLVNRRGQSKDMLGRIYEYFLGRFAQIEGRGGEFYTPQSVVKLLVEMIEPYNGKIYDPCCGTGGMFVQSEKFVLAHGGQLDDLTIYGQEMNPTTWRLCKMNLAMRGIMGNLGPQPADTFHRDLHPELKANFILANPPFNVSDWGGQRLRADARWIYGTPPLGNANFAWMQHIIHHLAPTGMAGLVLTNGALSTNQDGGDGIIRKAIVEADLVDCVVALPSQLFYNTQIAACIWFLARDKSDVRFRDRRGSTLFIQAQQCGRMIDRTHRELTDDDLGRIASSYHAWRNGDSSEYHDVSGFCKSATIDEVRTHKWALVPGRYVGFAENAGVPWDISQLRAELAQAEARLVEISATSQNALAVLKELLYG